MILKQQTIMSKSKTNNFSRLFSAVSTNTFYSDTCNSIKKNVKTVCDNYNDQNSQSHFTTKNDDTHNTKIKFITDVKYSILNHDSITNIFIFCELPGVEPKSIKMMFCGSNLMITCDKENPINTFFSESSTNNKIKINEKTLIGNAKYGTIKFNIMLPIIVNKTKNIKFEYHNGILKIIIPKTKEQEPIILSF